MYKFSMTAVFIIIVFIRPKINYKVLPIVLLFSFLFFMVNLFSASGSNSPSPIFISQVLGIIICYGAISVICTNERQIAINLLIISCIYFFDTLLGLAQALNLSTIIYYFTIDINRLMATSRVFGMHVNANSLAFASVNQLAFCYYLYGNARVVTKNIRKALIVRTMAIVFSIIAVPALILSMSRSGLLAAVFLFASLMAWERKFKVVFILAFLMLPIRYGIQLASEKESFERITMYFVDESQEAQYSYAPIQENKMDPRILLFQKGIRMFLDNPLFGGGPRSFQETDVFYELNDHQAAHSVYISALAELGLLGFLTLLLANIYPLKNIIVNMKRPLVFTLAFHYLSVSLFIFTTHGYVYHAYVWALTGLFTSVSAITYADKGAITIPRQINAEHGKLRAARPFEKVPTRATDKFSEIT